MAKYCVNCNSDEVVIKRDGKDFYCKLCFIREFETEVWQAIEIYGLFKHDDVIAVGVSGGKDSSALLHCLVTLKERYKYQWELVMVAIDEGIKGYRDNSLDCVYKLQEKYGLRLIVHSYEQLFDNWTMDRIVKLRGIKGSCTFCGTFRRRALEIGAKNAGASKIATGHNADDSVETVFLNILRGDIARFKACGITTECPCRRDVKSGGIIRTKPFYFSTQKEVVLYCHYNSLMYFSTECSYSVSAFRGVIRNFIRSYEKLDSSMLKRILHSIPYTRSCNCEAIIEAVNNRHTLTNCYVNNLCNTKNDNSCVCSDGGAGKSVNNNVPLGQSLKLTDINATSLNSNICSKCGFSSFSNVCSVCKTVEKLNKKHNNLKASS